MSRKSAALGFLICAAAGAQELQRYQASEPHMGTLAVITTYASSEEQAQQGFIAAFRRIHELDAIFSDYTSSSALSRVCEGSPAPAELLHVLGYAQALAEETKGAFDVTVGPVTKVWREARREKKLPEPEKVAQALLRSGYRSLRVEKDAIRCDKAGMQLDAGGIAKGYAADEALAALRKSGIQRAMVALSGDIVAGDPPPGRDGWRVQALGAVLSLANQAVSTSGDEFQFLEAGGKRYSHIIDPRTGRALENSTPVSVVAATGMEADSLATAISVGGRELAARLESTHKVRILLP